MDVAGLSVGRIVRVDFLDAQGEHGDGQEFEDVLSGGAVGDFGEEGTFLGASFGVGRGLDGANGAFDLGEGIS